MAAEVNDEVENAVNLIVNTTEQSGRLEKDYPDWRALNGK